MLYLNTFVVILLSIRTAALEHQSPLHAREHMWDYIGVEDELCTARFCCSTHKQLVWNSKSALQTRERMASHESARIKTTSPQKSTQAIELRVLNCAHH